MEESTFGWIRVKSVYEVFKFFFFIKICLENFQKSFLKF